MQEDASKPRAGEAPAPASFDLWGMASRLVGDVKKNAETFVSTIAETDWTKELADIQASLKEDTHALEHSVAAIAARELSADPAAASTSAEAFSLTRIGQSLVTGTREWIEQVRSTVEDEIHAASKDARKSARGRPARPCEGASKYSRLDAEISALQRNSSTYCDEPEDGAAFAEWAAGFDLAQRRPAIAAVLAENAFMAELHSRVVPLIVEADVFWQRYFYRLHKLMEAHEAHKSLVARTHAAEEPEIGWDDEAPATPAPATPPAVAAAPEGGAAAAALAAATATFACATLSDSGAAESGTAVTEITGEGDTQPGASQDAAADAGVAEAKRASKGDSGSAGPRARSSAAEGSGHASSDWSMVSSPAVAATRLAAGAAAVAAIAAEPEPSSAPPAAAAAANGGGDADSEMEDEEVSLGEAAADAEGGADEEIDEDWGEWD